LASFLFSGSYLLSLLNEVDARLIAYQFQQETAYTIKTTLGRTATALSAMLLLQS
jgi:hypothetical protein